MQPAHRPGVVYWIDHYTIPTNNLDRSIEFHERVMGMRTEMVPMGYKIGRLFQYVGKTSHGLFVQTTPLPPPEPLGQGYPRYGWYIRAEDVGEHVRRLDANNVEHSAPVRTSAEGEAGVAIYWRDVDGNQFEYWAPDQLPEGAMEGSGPLKIGRVSHAVYGSRDLRRTAAFFETYCSLQPKNDAAIPADTLVLLLAAGGRLVFKHVDKPGWRASGLGLSEDLHTALLVREDDFWPSYEKVWAGLPEWAFNTAGTEKYAGDALRLPPRSVLHPSPAGMAFKAKFGRGDDWIDWDGNLFHFYGGAPKNGSMATYEGHNIQYYQDKYFAAHPNGWPRPFESIPG